ncbi:MAG: phosphate ABC transporter substrate-binding protein [Methanotrichaceae archaeon]
MKKILAVILSALVLGSICVSAAAKNTISVSGSTTVMPLAEACAEAFNAKQTDYEIFVTGGGTGIGISNIAQGKSDIGMASREVTTDERSQFGNDFKENLVGYDGVTIAISKQIYDAGVKNLTKAQIKEIYSGTEKNWKAFGGPDMQIFAIARDQGSGTRDTFNEDIMGDISAETPGVDTIVNSNADVKKAITDSNNAIGYLGFSYSRDGSMGVITLNGVKPTPETIRNASYSLHRKLYLYTFGDPKPGAKAFIEFVQGREGQKIAEDNGFVPI